uniref:Pectin acetylesterase n=1 Tax=Palpitomonas bilix TaxID=652834 RepID=A0A7S3D656_9EUKA|mmetsp:Transcript_21438/g.55714  ORF Transcript_21438/g.55714 Transcript_21438/m.55714 type:complete len:296 (+) Transcript_21438:399-1286(+)
MLRCISVFSLLVVFCCSCLASADDGTLYRHFVVNATSRNAVCNDGSPPAYYVRLAEGSSDWLIYLEGGGGCYDEQSCLERYQSSQFLMTSSLSAETFSFSGPVSSNCTANPAMCRFNVAYIHYCSSDWWAGTYPSSKSGNKFHFFGRNIVQAVVEDLLDETVNSTISGSMKTATRVILAGDSAGGCGTFQHADSLASFLRASLDVGQDLVYGAIPDCGWFLGGDGFKEYACTNNEVCNVEHRFRSGESMWGLSPPVDCAAAHPSDLWKCLTGNVIYTFIKEPVFPFLFLTDAWQV